MKKILVIIVTFNAMKWVERCIGSINTSSLPADTFVVDNGSTDGTQEYIREHYPKVIFKQSSENLGFGRANNIGLQYAVDNNYDFVYLLNQDAWIFPETLQSLIDISTANPDYGIISPFQMQADLNHIDNNFIKVINQPTHYGEIINALYCKYTKDIYQVQGVMAAHWLITRECLMKTGGFSPTFPHYAEDFNYIDRAAYFGFKIGIVPSLKVVHDRANRVSPPAARMYMGYAVSLHELSKLNKSKRWLSVLSIMVKNIYEYKSLKPISYFFKIVKDYPTIKRNWKASSVENCAFLKHN